MITEDVSDLIKGGVAFGIPTTSLAGVPLNEVMYIVSIVAAMLLIFERLPGAYENLLKFKGIVYARVKK